MVGKSVVGAVHIREGKPCQDAIQWEEGDTFAILAVADGHGSKHSPYSDQGAQIAVEVAVDLLSGLYRQSRSSSLPLSTLKHYMEEQLPQALVRAWIERVKKHHATVSRHEEPPKQDLLVKYGSTLLATLLAQDFLLFLQLGDGDILVVADDGAVRPLPKDERLIADETTSLSTPHAWREMRVGWILTPDESPALVLLSTDGYANSFVSQQDFLKVG
ncbi:MAG: PP2C family serine/threonine-protein phosphatase, partial [Anaerolineae bacterium]